MCPGHGLALTYGQLNGTVGGLTLGSLCTGVDVSIMGKAGATRKALALGQRTLGEGHLPGNCGSFSSDLREEAIPWEQTAPQSP